MRVSTLAVSAFAGFAAAAPYYPFPLNDGFPKPSTAQLKEIQKLAGGSLPGGALATKLGALSEVTLQLIALNEIFEVAYFNNLLTNIQNNAYGYTSFPEGISRDYAIKTISTIRNQEELHYLGVNAALAAAGKTQIAPCKYNIPATVKDFTSAITLANVFTDVVLGVLPQAQTVFATDNPAIAPYVNLFGSVIAQEAEQNGWYRSVQKKVPSAAPFLTTEGPRFAFSFLKSVIADGCPGVDLVAKSVVPYPALTVLIAPSAMDMNIKFTVAGKIDQTKQSVAYLSGQNLPVTSNIYAVTYANGVSTFKAKFPFDHNGFAKGLTVAAVVNTPSRAYSSAAEVADHTVYGPGIIEVE